MRRTLQLLAFVVAAVGCQWATAADDWQTRSRVWQRDLVREARAVWGIDAPVPVMAGQIHQESLWRAHARSKYASGLAQFTPDTEAWIKAAYPQALAVGNAFDPRWAARRWSRCSQPRPPLYAESVIAQRSQSLAARMR